MRPMRVVQIERSELEILICTGTSDNDTLEKLGVAALTHAEEYGYHKHAIKIKRLLARVEKKGGS